MPSSHNLEGLHDEQFVAGTSASFSDHKRGPELDAAVDKVGNHVGLAGKADQFGAQLLHGHFPVAVHEALVEWTDNNVLRTRVISRKEVEVRKLAPSVLAFAPDGTPVAIQWSEDVTASSESDNYLNELGAFLAAEGLTRTFAATALFDTIKLEPGEILVETTDLVNRTQESKPTPVSAVGSEEVASWTFVEGPRGFRGCVSCLCNYHKKCV